MSKTKKYLALTVAVLAAAVTYYLLMHIKA